LVKLKTVCARFDESFEEGIVYNSRWLSRGRHFRQQRPGGTEEESGGTADILIGTLGKAFGVNGGYVVSGMEVIHYPPPWDRSICIAIQIR
jgi:glycine C-acetyltransferase